MKKELKKMLKKILNLINNKHIIISATLYTSYSQKKFHVEHKK